MKKILIADDEKLVRDLIKRLFGHVYKVMEADDGDMAIDIARNSKPDIILMDIMMPQMDGYTACYRLKSDRTTREIPVVMLTAIDHELNVRLSQEIGSQSYIVKPFQPQELVDTVMRLLSDL